MSQKYAVLEGCHSSALGGGYLGIDKIMGKVLDGTLILGWNSG